MIDQLIIEKYKKYGINDYVLKNVDDINKVHGIDVEMINGYSDLTKEKKELFKKFIVNFINGYGIKARTTFVPLSINDVEEIDYLGKKEPEDDFYVVLRREIKSIKADGSMELLKKSFDDLYSGLEIAKIEKRNYLRFEYEVYDEKTWQHVISPTEWY